MIKKCIASATALLAASASPAFAHGVGSVEASLHRQDTCRVFTPFVDRLPLGAVNAGAGMLWLPCNIG